MRWCGAKHEHSAVFGRWHRRFLRVFGSGGLGDGMLRYKMGHATGIRASFIGHRSIYSLCLYQGYI